tara:strand:- start:638 stop:868 length:231 start_codon:yes stop_codon:yes gene_type:complete
MEKMLLEKINIVLANRDRKQITFISNTLKLREDIGFDSFDLAELTVRLEEESGTDIFAEGIVSTVGEVLSKLERNA